MTQTHTDIVVVGAGPTGALTALGLAQRGRQVRLVEAQPAPVASPRAMVYYWHVLEGLDRLGVLSDMDARGIRNTSFLQRVPETGRQAEISLAPVADISPFAHNVHLGQHEVVRIALEHLAAFPNARVDFGTRATRVEATSRGATVHAQGPDGPVAHSASWVVAADGASSAIRRDLGLRLDGFTWPDRFVATNLSYPFDTAGGLGNANMLLDPEHGCVIARIDGSGLWRWTWSESAELPEESVRERIGGRLAALGFGRHEPEIVAVAPYRMHQRHVDRMRTGRVLLIGDAAHVTNPTGGLGLTSGMYDLFSLLDPLDAVVTGREPDTALDHWAAQRLRLFKEHASPMASASKHLVYDETDLAKREAAVRAAAEPGDRRVALSRLSAMTVLRGDLPTHHRELAGT
ncbi:FAD-dependent oxidoreductase [Streptomyces sp. NPDC057257]|uniref:FAD-dependent oxidoreductase n=1 Tax=Streptomyces sp. NPDC057257 TaxID=3346071 RepID=UPI0036355FA2